jgi:hypothetical protein
MSEWQPIETAPKDGTVIRVRNPMTRNDDMTLDAKWGHYTTPLGREVMEWVLVKDHDRFMPLRPGTLVIPTEWQPLPASPINTARKE